MANISTGTMYCAKRRTDGREWLDTESISRSPAQAERRAKELENSIPTWAASNPLVLALWLAAGLHYQLTQINHAVSDRWAATMKPMKEVQ